MKYANIKKHDIANGPGIRVSLYVSGCNHHCKGCFNKEAWDFNYGNNFTTKTINIHLHHYYQKYHHGQHRPNLLDFCLPLQAYQSILHIYQQAALTLTINFSIKILLPKPISNDVLHTEH